MKEPRGKCGLLKSNNPIPVSINADRRCRNRGTSGISHTTVGHPVKRATLIKTLHTRNIPKVKGIICFTVILTGFLSEMYNYRGNASPLNFRKGKTSLFSGMPEKTMSTLML